MVGGICLHTKCKAQIIDIEQAFQPGVLTEDEARKLNATEEAIAKAIAVDDFAAESLTGIHKEQP